MMIPKRFLGSFVSLYLLGLLAVLPGGGCAGPYYIEGQDETGDLPDSLQVLIDTRNTRKSWIPLGRQPLWDPRIGVDRWGTSAANRRQADRGDDQQASKGGV